MIPFLDLARDYAQVEAEARRRLDGVLARQQFVLGPETAELENAFEKRTGAGTAVAVSSGTDALRLSLLALGIGPGDAVLVPAFTFFATAGAVSVAGALPVFCDIDRATFVAGAKEMRRSVEQHFHREGGVCRHRETGARLAALIPVHLYGRASAIEEIAMLGRELGASVIEDAAQAIDCRSGGKSVGSFGDTGCFSFYPTKNLGGPGDGGLVVCEDAALGARLKRLRTHGSEQASYDHREVGMNARMPELVAAVLNAKLARLDAWTERRREIAARYHQALADAAAHGLVELPSSEASESHVWHQYAVRIGGDGRRDRVRKLLADIGIATSVFYPLPLHLQSCFAALGGKAGDLPEAERAAGEVLCLPIYASLGDASVDRVAAALSEAAMDSRA